MKEKLVTKNERLYFDMGGPLVELKVHQCVPWSNPEGLLSLRDESDEEKYFVTDLADLDATISKVIKKQLDLIRFTFEIGEIESITDEFELRKFVVKIKGTSRTFYTKLDEYPKVQARKVKFTDTSGETYATIDTCKLDRRSRDLLRPLID